MKKIIIGLSGLVVLAFLTVLVVNAQDKDKKGTKAKSEVTHDCSKCPSAATCASSTSAPEAVVAPDDTTKCKAGKCDPAKCKEGKCDPVKCKEGKCDPAKCKEAKCEPAGCKKECKSSATAGMKCDTTKCSMHKAENK